VSGFPIRARVALALVLVVVPAALGFVYFTQRARREAALETVYETALARMEEGGRERCEDRPRRAMRRERRLLATYDAALVSRDPDAPRVPAAVGEAFAAGEVAVLDPRSPRRALLRMPWDEGPCAVLLVELPSPQRGTAVRDVGLMLAVLALSLAAALVALGGPLRRLGALAHAAKAPGGIARLAVPRGTRGADEVGVLSAALDEAATAARAQLAELEAKSRALRGYVDGTTHDLAVPLTVLQGQLAELRAQAGVDPAALEGAISSVTYLGQLAANLATAARLEQGAAPLDRRPVDLGVVVDRVIARLTPIARHRRVELAASLPDEKVFLDGDELLLERALSNLVHNAIRHRPDGPGHVAVIVRAEPTSVIVKGDGAKVDDRTLALLRAGEAPSDASRTRGRGIGLSIVRQVARRHGLALVFERADGGTLEVTLTRAGPGSEPTDANG
jgi:signal transduction histidine kinase